MKIRLTRTLAGASAIAPVGIAGGLQGTAKSADTVIISPRAAALSTRRPLPSPPFRLAISRTVAQAAGQTAVSTVLAEQVFKNI